MESPSFTYTVLPEGRFFRLLKVHAGSPSDKLVCELFECHIDRGPPYTAISYVWGDSAKSAEIICLGHVCNITQSLSDALGRLRKTHEAQIAWADAICINQCDQAEKGHQVDLMGLIYERATGVLVWLGPDLMKASDKAFRAIRIINEKIFTKTDKEWYVPRDEELPFRNLSIRSSSSEEPVKIPTTTVGKRSVLSFVLGDRERECIRELFSLAWFSRVWVLQEVGLATTATAYWGDTIIDFSEIAEFIQNVYFSADLKRFLGPEASAALAGAPVYGLWNVWATYEKKDSWMYRSPTLRAFAEQLADHHDVDFTLVLEASRYFDATNKLDHIYAFLGHPKAKRPGVDKTWLQADYSLSLEEQHRLLVSSMARDSLNFLVQSQQTEQSVANSGRPSWVPIWNEKNPMHAEAFWEMCDASLRKAERQAFEAVANGDKLAVAGLIIDTIDQFTPTMQKTDFEPISIATSRLVEQCWETTKHKPSPYLPEETLQAFALTLVCHYNKTRDNRYDHGSSMVDEFGGFCYYANVESFKNLKRKIDGSWTLDTSVVDGERFGEMFKTYATNQRFFNTKTAGLWGLGPAAMQQGDVCAVLFGADVPFILRQTRTKGEYKVVGQYYMYKFMDGESAAYDLLPTRRHISSLSKPISLTSDKDTMLSLRLLILYKRTQRR